MPIHEVQFAGFERQPLVNQQASRRVADDVFDRAIIRVEPPLREVGEGLASLVLEGQGEKAALVHLVTTDKGTFFEAYNFGKASEGDRQPGARVTEILRRLDTLINNPTDFFKGRGE